MKYPIQGSEAELNGMFYLSSNENICSIAQMRKHSLFVLCNLVQKFKFLQKFKRKVLKNDSNSN